MKRDEPARRSLERETDTDSRILPHPGPAPTPSGTAAATFSWAPEGGHSPSPLRASTPLSRAQRRQVLREPRILTRPLLLWLRELAALLLFASPLVHSPLGS